MAPGVRLDSTFTFSVSYPYSMISTATTLQRYNGPLRRFPWRKWNTDNYLATMAEVPRYLYIVCTYVPPLPNMGVTQTPREPVTHSSQINCRRQDDMSEAISETSGDLSLRVGF